MLVLSIAGSCTTGECFDSIGTQNVGFYGKSLPYSVVLHSSSGNKFKRDCVELD